MVVGAVVALATTLVVAVPLPVAITPVTAIAIGVRRRGPERHQPHDPQNSQSAHLTPLSRFVDRSVAQPPETVK